MRTLLPRISLIALILTTSCSRLQVPLNSLPADLIVYTGAREIRTFQRPGGIELDYVVNQTFPATDFLATIDKTLRAAGWQALLTDPLTGDPPSSQVNGWTSFTDGRRAPERVVHQWMASWRNPAGDFAVYALRYESTRGEGPPPATPHNATVTVSALHVSAKAAASMIESSRQFPFGHDGPTTFSLKDEDAKVLQAVSVDPGRPRSFVNRSRAMCTGEVEGGCVQAETIASVRPLDGLVAGFRERNRITQDVPNVAGSDSVTPEAWTRTGSGPTAAKGQLLWCTLPAYSLGEAVIACLERPAAGGPVSESVYLLEHDNSSWHMKSGVTTPRR